MTARVLTTRLIAAPLLLLPTACTSHVSRGPDADHATAAAAPSTCVDHATTVSSFPNGYPHGFPMPAGTVVYDVEDRGHDGVIATGVTATPFDDVLRAMNNAKQAGYTVTSGETEENDAEANWTGNGYVGRWAIEKSATCPHQTVIQLLSKKNTGN